ncbi:MAG: YceI family protein [Steroidobacteraceae bacterium]
MAPAVILRLLCACLVCCPAAVAAADFWQADQRSGTLNFSATQAGAKFTGGFERFHVKLDFDPTKPADGNLHVTVATPSIDTADAERDEILRSRDFFWTEQHPEAVFHAERIERDGADWRAQGELTIRGATRPATVRFALTPEKDNLVMKGAANLRRLAFGLGQGDWASTEWIGDEVDVRFELTLARSSMR